MVQLPDLKNLPDKSPREMLIVLLKFVKNWSMFEGIGQDAAIEFFMDWVGNLYLDYFQHHLDEAKKCGFEHKKTLKAIIEPIKKNYIHKKWRRFESMRGDLDLIWAELCEARTNIEAFQEMFGEITGPFEGYLVEDFYERIEANKDMALALRSDEIPKNVPRSHWWWFYESKVTQEEIEEFNEFCRREKEKRKEEEG